MKKYCFQLPNGLLILSGKNLPLCTPYIDECVESAEDICEYCSEHNLDLEYRILNVAGFLEYVRILILARKYKVKLKLSFMFV